MGEEEKVTADEGAKMLSTISFDACAYGMARVLQVLQNALANHEHLKGAVNNALALTPKAVFDDYLIEMMKMDDPKASEIQRRLLASIDQMVQADVAAREKMAGELRDCRAALQSAQAGQREAEERAELWRGQYNNLRTATAANADAWGVESAAMRADLATAQAEARAVRDDLALALAERNAAQAGQARAEKEREANQELLEAALAYADTADPYWLGHIKMLRAARPAPATEEGKNG